MSDQPRTILIVDDREENRYTTRHALTRAGFLTTEASTGREALEMAKSMPDVIVLDIRLPDMLGYEVCRRLRANPQLSHIPVLQLSATFLTTESRLYALESGADAYLTQPADPLILVATVRSLVRLHDAERQAKKAAHDWAATFDALSEGVGLVEQGVVKRCNRAMTELLSAPYSEVEGARFADILKRHFGVERLTGAEDVQVGGRFFRLSTVAFPENDRTAEDIFLVAEVTPEKHAEQALLLNERLAATGRMAHTIAHEINNPLESITNLIYLAQSEQSEPEETKEFLRTAADEVARISQISRQILSFHREATVPVVIPIAELVQDVLALTERSAFEKRLEVVFDADRSLTVMGFPARLRQAFSNVIRNAVEASPQGGKVWVRVSRASIRAGAAEQPAVRVTVGDQGPGIAAAHLPRIWDAFYTTKAQKGSGVGLWLTLTIVREHGGRIQVRVREGSEHGSVFSILLPAGSLLR